MCSFPIIRIILAVVQLLISRSQTIRSSLLSWLTTQQHSSIMVCINFKRTDCLWMVHFIRTGCPKKSDIEKPIRLKEYQVSFISVWAYWGVFRLNLKQKDKVLICLKASVNKCCVYAEQKIWLQVNRGSC